MRSKNAVREKLGWNRQKEDGGSSIRFGGGENEELEGEEEEVKGQ